MKYKDINEAFKMPPKSAREVLYLRQQELRKKAGLPNPDEYLKQIKKKKEEIKALE